MIATLKIYRVESGRNGTLWAMRKTPPPAPPRSGEGSQSSPPSRFGKGAGGLGLLDEIRRRAIRETEQYLSDLDNASWPRSDAGRMTPAA